MKSTASQSAADGARGGLLRPNQRRGCFFVSTALLFLEVNRTDLSLSVLETMSAVAATLGNVGPGFGVVGPMGNYLPFSAPAKLFMVLLMWVGRLEIIPVLVLLTPEYWRS